MRVIEKWLTIIVSYFLGYIPWLAASIEITLKKPDSHNRWIDAESKEEGRKEGRREEAAGSPYTRRESRGMKSRREKTYGVPYNGSGPGGFLRTRRTPRRERKREQVHDVRWAVLQGRRANEGPNSLLFTETDHRSNGAAAVFRRAAISVLHFSWPHSVAVPIKTPQC